MRFSVNAIERSPRIVPGAASRRVRRPHQGADDRRGALTLDHHGHDRAAGDERDQVLEERLAVVLAVVHLRDVDLERAQLERDDRQVLGFDAPDDLADELALDRIRLAENEGPVSHGSGTLPARRRPPGNGGKRAQASGTSTERAAPTV